MNRTVVLPVLLAVCLASSLFGQAWTGQLVDIQKKAGHESSPAVAYASEADEFLVVWEQNDDIYGCFVSGSGAEIIDPFPICADTGSTHLNPDVAYNHVDDQFMVVWVDSRKPESWDIFFALLDRDGKKIVPAAPTVMADTTAPVCDHDSTQYHPKVAHNYIDNTYLVVWMDYRESYPRFPSWDIYAQRISSGGALLPPYDPPSSKVCFPVVKWDYDEMDPDVAFHGGTGLFPVDEWIVVWATHFPLDLPCSRIFGRRINGKTGVPIDNYGNGAVLPPPPAKAAADGRSPFSSEFPIGYDGQGSFFSFSRPFIQGSPHIISNDVWPEPVLAKAQADPFPCPEFLVTWTDFRNHSESFFDNGDVYCQRIAYLTDSVARLLQAEPETQPPSDLPTIVLVDENGDLPDPPEAWITWPNIQVTDNPAYQSWNEAGFVQNSGEYLVLWNDWRATGWQGSYPPWVEPQADLYGQRLFIDPADSGLVWLDLDGQPMADRTTNIAVAADTADEGDVYYPAVAQGTIRDKALVVYQFDRLNNDADTDLQGTLLGGGVSEVKPAAGFLPRDFRVLPNYPNPFNPETVIPFEMPRGGRVHIAVYDAVGRERAVLMDGILTAGYHDVHWNAEPERASGIYLVRLESGGLAVTRKVVLMR
jgi:hypothetical protein